MRWIIVIVPDKNVSDEYAAGDHSSPGRAGRRELGAHNQHWAEGALLLCIILFIQLASYYAAA